MLRLRRFAPAAAGLMFAVGLSAAPAAAQNADDVAAKVGDHTITVGEVEQAFRGLGPRYQQQGFGQLYPLLLERMIQQRILMQEGRAEGLADDPEVEARIEELRDQVIHDVYLSRLVEQEVGEERLKAEYDKFIENNPPKEEVKARHILVDTEDQAKQIIQQVTDGEPFAELAKKHSTGPSGERGGELGWFGRGQMVEAFEKVAFKLKPNQFTADPVKTRFGWHVIMVDDKRTSQPPSFEDIRPQLLDRVGQEVAMQIAIERTKQADVERFDMSGKPMQRPQIGDAQ